MFLELLSHQYFWLSFAPMAALGGGFWLLYFDRVDRVQEPLVLLLLALVAGALSAVGFSYVMHHIPSHFVVQAFGEEVAKMLCALVVMEAFRRRFKTVSQGIMYGFAVGLGFAVAENMLYLLSVHQSWDFGDAFWMTFQLRFWFSSLLHASTMAFFGLYYASAYLSPYRETKRSASPLWMVAPRLNLYQWWQVLTLHIARRHLLFCHKSSLHGHAFRTFLWEGFFLAGLLHAIFNAFLLHGNPIIAYVLPFFCLAILSRKKGKTD